MRCVYLERKSFVKYDDTHYLVYLNEEVLPDYVPEVMEEQPTPEPTIGYAYSGTEADGGTLIETTASDRNSLINGIIRSRYTQSEEDAIKTHQIELLKDASIAKAADYEAEWIEFNSVRNMAKAAVDSWV